MNPQLSQRVAKVMSVMRALGMTGEEYMGLAIRVESAEDFEALPENDRRAILAAERMVDAGLTLRQIMDMNRRDLGIPGGPDFKK